MQQWTLLIYQSLRRLRTSSNIKRMLGIPHTKHKATQTKLFCQLLQLFSINVMVFIIYDIMSINILFVYFSFYNMWVQRIRYHHGLFDVHRRVSYIIVTAFSILHNTNPRTVFYMHLNNSSIIEKTVHSCRLNADWLFSWGCIQIRKWHSRKVHVRQYTIVNVSK